LKEIKNLTLPKNIVDLISYAGFGVLFILSIVLWKERIIHVDTAFQVFKWINFEKINIEASRYAAIFPQLIPLIFIKLGSSLRTILIVSSLSFTLMQFIVFLIIRYGYKDILSSFGLVLSLVICTALNFYFPVAEAYQALYFLMLFYVHFRHFKGKYIVKNGLSAVLILLCLFAHPSSIFGVIFIVGLFFLETKKWKESIFAIAITGLYFAIKMLTTDGNSYEGNLFAQIGTFGDNFLNIPSLYSTQFFLRNIFSKAYYIFPMLLLTVVAILGFKKEKWKVIFSLAFTLIFFVVTVLIFHQGEADAMLEKSFILIGLFAVIASIDILKQARAIALFYFLGSTILIFKLFVIANTHVYFTNRLMKMQAFLDAATTSKSIVKNDNIDIGVPWAVGVETLLLSASQNNCKTVYLESQQIQKQDTLNPNLFLFIHAERNRTNTYLSKKYFNLKNEPYSVLDMGSNSAQ